MAASKPTLTASGKPVKSFTTGIVPTPTKKTVKVVKQFLAWSYSRLHAYQQCPLSAKLKFLDKVPEPESAALANGSAVHKLAEQFTNKILKKLPAELKLFADSFKGLVKAHAQTEQQWAFTRVWAPTGWFDKDCWVRVVIDAFYFPTKTTVVVVDHKTGRIREEQKEQLSLYALAALLKFPEVDTVICQFWYLDHGQVVELTFTKAELPALKKQWEKASQKMMADKMFAPRPGDACRWCHFSAAKLGLCKF